MKQGYSILATALIITTFVLAQASEGPAKEPRGASPTPTVSSASVATSTPELLIGQSPAYDPLPEGCSAMRVLNIVEELLHAINRGNQGQLASVFRPGILDADSTPSTMNAPEPGWFGVEAPPTGSDENTLHGIFSRNNPNDVEAWLAARHDQDEHWTLRQLFMGGYWWKGGVNIAFNVQREAKDMQSHIVGGKGAVDCNHATVSCGAWAVHRLSSIPRLTRARLRTELIPLQPHISRMAKIIDK